MNRKIKSIAVSFIAAAVSVGMLAGCGSSKSSDDNGKGKVYYLNFKPEVAKEWKALASEYTKQTGVQVTVETAASDTYDQQLKSEMSKSEAPTLFQINGPVGYDVWKDYTADLKDTEVYKQLQDPSMAIKDGSKVAAVPYVTESYGIIYNKNILDKYFAMSGAKIKSIKDVNSFASLKTLSDDLQAHKSDLGIKGAFTSAGFDSSSDWRFKTQLANVPLYYEFQKDHITKQPKTVKGTYLPQFKDIFDLYLKDSTTEPSQLSSKTGDDANSEFALGEAPLYQNGTWAWSDLQKAGVKPDQLGMLPIYIGAPGEKDQGLTTGSENYWCVNAKASSADQKATEAFLKWVITSKDGKQGISKTMGFNTPFKSFSDVKADNPLIEAATENRKEGKKQVDWDYTMMPSEQWKNDLGNALLEYAQGTGKWDQVKTNFVDGWAKEYQAAHSK
ncbi:ABC transporter substrate-binding protein [Bifidobacterium sp. ESL0798]|uniref:ABC transporter substrate-binding protein n=1 Tax=Bifidobacterium sp. ESL0798 TaxID=2983235 RepID=UPI0023F9402F|nr:ABC transporter substrate-binding protein [Bifidobacterium sp. ESL0798]WEV73917.1 ABC transporter substrate-binding protein [Bifidobacterium sp. ESL0798]